jgi:hypothetical protein
MDADTTRTLDIALHLELDGEELDGVARVDGRPGRAFSGWVGLIAALDALTAPDDGGATGRETPA